MSFARSVLIVDRLSETREVLRTVLERRGLRIFEAAEQEEGWKIAREHHPDLIVMDVEEYGSPRDAAAPETNVPAGRVPLVLLGSARKRETDGSGKVYVSKPFQYVDLIRRIEAMLAGFAGESPKTTH
jgi:CheY-like chemotaxis protein